MLIRSMLFGVISLWLGLGCTPSTAPKTHGVDPVKINEPTQVSTQVDFRVLEKDLPVLRLRAGEMARFERTDSVYAILSRGKSGKSVQVSLFDEKGTSSAEVSMDTLVYLEENLKFIAKGNVQVKTSGNRELSAQYLTWDRKSRKLSARGLVRYRSPNEQFQGYDLVTDEHIQQYSIRNLSGQGAVQGL